MVEVPPPESTCQDRFLDLPQYVAALSLIMAREGRLGPFTFVVSFSRRFR